MGGTPNAKVLVIVYQGEAATYSPIWLVDQQIQHIAAGTSFHGTSRPSIAFGLAGSVNISYTYPPTGTNGYINLKRIYEEFSICQRATQENINEVWIYVDGKVNGNVYSPDEFLTNGPVWTKHYGYPDIDPPNCGRQMYTMLYNFDVGDEQELESWAHSAEWAFLVYESAGSESCDVGKPFGIEYGDAGWTTQQCNDTVGYSAVNGFMVLPDAVNNYVSVCGDVHYPPNIPAALAVRGYPEWEYIYDSPNTYQSRCTNWQWNTLTNTMPVSGATWGNTQVGYLKWWMQNMPGISNTLRGRNNAIRPNWWDFRLIR